MLYAKLNTFWDETVSTLKALASIASNDKRGDPKKEAKGSKATGSATIRHQIHARMPWAHPYHTALQSTQIRRTKSSWPPYFLGLYVRPWWPQHLRYLLRSYRSLRVRSIRDFQPLHWDPP